MKKRDLILMLTDSLQETRQLAAVSHEGDPWYAENEGIDTNGVFTRARDALGIAEEYRENPKALEDYD